MNTAESAKEMGLTEAELFELLEMFSIAAQSDVDAIGSAASEGDAIKAVRHAHSMKGAAGSLGLSEIHEDARLIEDAARAGDLSTAQRILPSLARHVGELVRAYGPGGAALRENQSGRAQARESEEKTKTRDT